LPAFTRAGELKDSSVSEAYSSGPCAHKNWNGDALGAAENWRPVLAQKQSLAIYLACSLGIGTGAYTCGKASPAWSKTPLNPSLSFLIRNQKLP